MTKKSKERENERDSEEKEQGIKRIDCDINNN